MGNPSTIKTHPRAAELLAAIASDESNLSISRRFGVSEIAVRRHRKANPQPPAPDFTPSPASPASRPRSVTPPPADSSADIDDDHLFDLLSMHFPLEPGERRSPDPSGHDLRLRQVQQRFGVEAVRMEVLVMVGQFRRLKRPAYALAKMLDVPIAAVDRWMVIREEADREALFKSDPKARYARRHADLMDRIAAIDEKLSAKPGDRVFATLTGERRKLEEDLDGIYAKLGLDKVEEWITTDAKILHQHIFDLVTAALPQLAEAFAPAREDLDTLYAQRRKELKDEYDQAAASGQELPPWNADDPGGWQISEQGYRRQQAWKLATGRSLDDPTNTLPTDGKMIPGYRWMPKDIAPVVDHLRTLLAAERLANVPEPAPEPDDEAA
jgi:hypothetical protein